MKNEIPELELVKVNAADVIVTSCPVDAACPGDSACPYDAGTCVGDTGDYDISHGTHSC